MPFAPEFNKKESGSKMGPNFTLAHYIWDTILDIFEYLIGPEVQSKLNGKIYVELELDKSKLKVYANMEKTTKNLGVISKYTEIALSEREERNLDAIMGILMELAENDGMGVKIEVNERGHLVWKFRQE